ncbi:MAG TPA: type II toxin-antitoxin system prevent-host-death family antitoxin [Streptosporangiaceae bacterium]
MASGENPRLAGLLDQAAPGPVEPADRDGDILGRILTGLLGLPELLSRIEGGEEVTITRHGRPVAVLVRPDALRSRRAGDSLDDAARVHQLLTEAAASPLPPDTGLTTERAEELISQIRAGRDQG